MDRDEILSHAGVLVGVLDLAGRLVYLNQSASAGPADAVLGRHYRAFLRPTQRSRFREAFDRALKSRSPQTILLTALDGDGRPRRYATVLTPYWSEGRPCCVVLASLDLTFAKLFGGPEDSAAALAAALPPRQRAVLRLVAAGRSNKQIARSLGVAVRTVETHREQLASRLALRGTADLTRFAVSAGLV